MKQLLNVLICYVFVFGASCHLVPRLRQRKDLTDLMVRVAQLEINEKDLAAYKKILVEEAAASVRLEPGVIAIFPMQQRETDNEIRILEIYANEEAYQAHLKTPHFKKYKSTTSLMVKSLKLVDMEAMDKKMMAAIFHKVQ